MLKNSFTSALILRHFDPTKEVFVEYDMSVLGFKEVVLIIVFILSLRSYSKGRRLNLYREEGVT
jgi:hypothetical protein